MSVAVKINSPMDFKLRGFMKKILSFINKTKGKTKEIDTKEIQMDLLNKNNKIIASNYGINFSKYIKELEQK